MPTLEVKDNLASVMPLDPIKNQSHTRPRSETNMSLTCTKQIPARITKNMINILPPELVANIIQFLGPIFGAVFGLTYHQVYDEFKRQYPATIPLSLETYLWNPDSQLDLQHPRFHPSAQLHQLLGTWMGSGDSTKYFYFRDESLKYFKSWKSSVATSGQGGQFLLQSIYGEGVSGSDHAIKQLLVAWCAYGSIEEGWPWVYTDEEIPADEIQQYPSPFNMSGQGWLDNMQEILTLHHPDLESPFRALAEEGIGWGNGEYGKRWSAVEARKKQLDEHVRK
ncbi:hypothetical protein SBOR_7878 [Sclerotinia borealis F-4128]|uniref:F-box domain-containing protein n=1 Tax=Sclerotinia borealis (strain F-4128) TaxID=1432307 RepID=W9C4N3_SCLBF|nr:hypothetical protein SBOR_7878 [Sclerotinia borealis F-4128]